MQKQLTTAVSKLTAGTIRAEQLKQRLPDEAAAAELLQMADADETTAAKLVQMGNQDNQIGDLFKKLAAIQADKAAILRLIVAKFNTNTATI